MRVGFISPYFIPANVYGGPLYSSLSLCKTLVNKGFEVHVLTTNANGDKRLSVPLGVPVNLNGITIFYYPLISNFSFLSLEFLKAVNQKIPHMDIVFLQLMWSYTLLSATKVAKMHGIPYVIPLKGQLLPVALDQKPLRKKLFLGIAGKRILLEASCLLCSDQSEIESLGEFHINSPTFILNNMVDELFFDHEYHKGFLREKMNIPDDSFIILFLGRIHSYKRPDLAWKSLPNELIFGREIHLVYAGVDQINFIPELKKNARRNGIDKRVHYAGNLDRIEVLKSLYDSDLLIMPSETESFGMSAAEALAVGLPIITSPYVPVGIMAEKVGAGKVVENSPYCLSKEILDLLSDPVRLRSMSKIAKEFAFNEFHPDMIAGRLVDLINNISRQ